MAEFDDQMIDTNLDSGDNSESKSTKRFSFVKVGVPVLIVQIILAYFLANNMIVPRLYGDSADTQFMEDAGQEIENDESESRDFGKIFAVEDVIVNPAESKGMQFVLINFGFEVKEDSNLEAMKKREIQIRDILIRILGAKTLAELDGPEDKENMRAEVKESIKGILPSNHLLNVYFSNYIIQ